MALLWPFAVMAGAAAPLHTLTTLRAVHSLSNDQAALSYPVAFEGTVTYYAKHDVDMFVQDGDDAIYVQVKQDLNVAIGDRVLVEGSTRASFRPEVAGEKISVIRHGVLPVPIQAQFKQMIRADLDCRLVTVRAVVRSANSVFDGAVRSLYLQMEMDGGALDAEVVDASVADPNSLLDSEVQVTGAVAGKFDSKMQMTGILLEVPALSDVKILKHIGAVPRVLPVTPMDEILKGSDVQDHTQRMRVEGTITYYQPGSGVVLQNGAKSAWVMTQYQQPMHVGDFASASGFPAVRNGSVILTQGEIEDSGRVAPIAVQDVSPTELALGSHAFELVSVQGRLLTQEREAAKDEYVLESDGHLFSAVYRHPEHGADLRLPPMKNLPLGSIVRVTGICSLESGDKFWGPVAFDVLLRSSDDLLVVKNPSLLSVNNLMILVGMLLVVVLFVGARSWSMERRVRTQTAELANLERRRGRILEDINCSRPLADIIEQITELVSFKLRGAPCWCELADGIQFGNHPKPSTSLRTIESPIRNATGNPHGTISAALHALAKPIPAEGEALAMAAELATLAIETNRLYSDLRHRSEFDLLTDIHNRFSLEKRLEELLSESNRSRQVFGLIYVDLDGFKQINDQHGHQFGDAYLQQVALRMKHQIRPDDMLARLGGDEFAVLVPSAISRVHLEEIARRLERCLGSPFSIGRVELRGSASFGVALYPEDGATKDSLLNAADAAMYVAKHTKGPAADAVAAS
ncbi:MAG TPA: GGDEF domain-containing protein [Terracidiphilus sp.]|nr:GGDEF domain-containing protein [Terracidiphilus sp.]